MRVVVVFYLFVGEVYAPTDLLADYFAGQKLVFGLGKEILILMPDCWRTYS
jgi:hypothetical protein